MSCVTIAQHYGKDCGPNACKATEISIVQLVVSKFTSKSLFSSCLEQKHCLNNIVAPFQAVVQEKFDEWWPDALRILARATPADKSAFVRAVMASGKHEVVAVTASGAEDGRTLEAADVGIAMVGVSSSPPQS